MLMELKAMNDAFYSISLFANLIMNQVARIQTKGRGEIQGETVENFTFKRLQLLLLV